MKNHPGFTEYCQNYIPDFCSPRTSAPFLFNQARLGNQLTTERAPKRTRYPALKTLRQSSNNSPSHYWSNITKPQRKKERKMSIKMEEIIHVGPKGVLGICLAGFIVIHH